MVVLQDSLRKHRSFAHRENAIVLQILFLYNELARALNSLRWRVADSIPLELGLESLRVAMYAREQTLNA